LEALLGQLPARNESIATATAQQPAAPAASETTSHDPLPPVSLPPQNIPAAPSAEAMFRLDVPHASPSQFFASPHHAAVAPSQSAQAADASQPRQTDFQSEDQEKQEKTPPKVSVRLIDSNPAQPRQDFDPDELKSLAESLSAHGLLQPLVVRQVGERYQLVAGERRLRAAALAGWSDVPVHVVEADDRQMAELAIVENLQRKDLNALEKAASFQNYIQEYGCTQEELAGRLKLDRSTIANLIRLLELPETVQEAIRRGKITQGHARALLPLGDEREQVEFCNRIQREGLNVRQTEAMVQEMIDAADRGPLSDVVAPEKPTRKSQAKNENLAALEQRFHTALGLKVKITHNARGRGKLVIQFRNNEEFEQLEEQICGS
jgi:ParB family chromosome partitioning protein